MVVYTPMHVPEAALRYQLTVSDEGPLGAALLDRAFDLADPLEDLEVLAQLDEVRDQFERLATSPHPDDKESVETMNSNFQNDDADYLPNHLRNETLLSMDVVQWIIGASRPQLLDMLAWNTDRYQAHRTQLRQDLPRITEDALAGIDAAIDTGLMPPRTKKLVRDAVKATHIIPLDSFEAGKHLCTGYYELRTGILGLANHYHGGEGGFSSFNGRRVLRHEFVHAIRAHIGGGLETVLPGRDKAGYRWLDEMWTEHVAQVGEFGMPNILDPFARDDLGSYQSYRSLGSLSFCEGPVTIPLNLFGEAFVEPLDSAGKARRKLDRQLHGLFDNWAGLGGMHIVAAASRDIQQAPRSKAEEVADQWIQKIHDFRGTTPPETWKEYELPTSRANVLIVREVAAAGLGL